MTRTMEQDVKDKTYLLKIYNFTQIHGSLETTSSSNDNNEVEPLPRSGHRIQCTDACLYSVGGYRRDHDRERLFREVWMFDFITKKWTKLKAKNLPKELASCSTLLSGNLLFLSGGTGLPFGRNLNESLYYCNLPKSDTSIKFEEITPSPLARYGHSMVLNDDYLYTIGGTSGSVYSMDVYAFNLRTSEWKKLYDCIRDDDGPPARYRHEMVCYNDRIYIFGGGTQSSTFTLETIPAFDLKTNRWQIFKTIGDIEDVEKFPVQRKCHGCAQDPYLPSIVYINGGCRERTGDDRSPTPLAFGDTWRIDLETLKWKRIASLSLPYGIYFHSVTATPDGRMCVFGGISDKHDPHERTADMFVSWISIPKLADACWEALLHYIRNGTIILPKDLRSFGLPKKYENRLIRSGLAHGSV